MWYLPFSSTRTTTYRAFLRERSCDFIFYLEIHSCIKSQIKLWGRVIGPLLIFPHWAEWKRERELCKWKDLTPFDSLCSLRMTGPFCLHGASGTQPPTMRKNPPGKFPRGGLDYFAYSTALVSRMTLILIWPGYSSSDSIFLAMSRASRIMLSSVTTSGLTMMRTSRPA